MRASKRMPWPMALAVQFLVMAILSAAACLMPLAFPEALIPLQLLLGWILTPLLGAASSCLVTLRGANAYLPWMLPPVLYAAIPWMLIGYPPDAGIMLLCALTSLIGSAVGDVIKRQNES